MTTFQYENSKEIRKLADRFFGENGEIKIISGIDSIKFYKYLLAYRIVYGRQVKLQTCKQLEERAFDIDFGMNNKMFFEKAQMNVSVKDIIYFEDYMRMLEKDIGFLSCWYVWFDKVV